MKLGRKIDEYLLIWKEKRKTALLVDGARQTGKTFSINAFGEREFDSFVRLDFSSSDALQDVLSRSKSSGDFLIRLSSFCGDKLIKGRTLIFFDEIQFLYKRRQALIEKGEIDGAYPDLISLMKPLSEEGSYRYILSGSLLGISISGVTHSPVGYLDTYTMYPLDFEEYLLAKGVGKQAIGAMKDCFVNKIAPDPGMDRMFADHFKEYVLIGGMPEAVSIFLESHNLHLAQTSQENVMGLYVSDIMNYVDDPQKKLRIRDIYEAIPSELNAKNKRFVSSHVIDINYLKRNDLSDEYLWLTSTGIALPVYNVDQPLIPLYVSKDRKTMKLFYNDIGLLAAALLETGTREKLLSGEINVNYGAPYENAVAEQLWAHGFKDRLYYYNSKKNGEVDFLVEKQGSIIPIEVKSGKPEDMNKYNHCALNKLISLYDYQEAYVFGQGGFLKESEVIWQFPIYMASFLERKY